MYHYFAEILEHAAPEKVLRQGQSTEIVIIGVLLVENEIVRLSCSRGKLFWRDWVGSLKLAYSSAISSSFDVILEVKELSLVVIDVSSTCYFVTKVIKRRKRALETSRFRISLYFVFALCLEVRMVGVKERISCTKSSVLF